MIWLLAATGLLLLLAGVGTAFVIRAQNRERAYKDRVAGITAKGPARDTTPTLVRRLPKQKASVTERLAAVIGYDPIRRQQYKLRWYVVFGLALAAGRAAVMAAAGIAGPWAWVLLPVVAIGGTRVYHTGADRKRRETLLAQFPDALSLIVRAVRVGIPVSESLGAVSREMPPPTNREFERLRQEIAVGASLEVAVRDLARRNALPEYGFFAAVLALQAQTGGALTETLESLADIIRRRIAMKERGHALSSEARTSSYVLAGLPGVAGGLLWFLSPEYMNRLFTDPMGHMFLGAAALSLLTGMGIMRTIIRRTLS